MENSEPDTGKVSRPKRGRSHQDRIFQRGVDCGLASARSGLQTASNVAHAAGVDASSTDSDKVSQGLRVAGLNARARPAPQPHRSEAAVESQRLLLRRGRPLAGNGGFACHWCHAEASLTCATCGRSECETCRFQYSDRGSFALEEAHCMPCRHNNSLKEKSKAATAAGSSDSSAMITSTSMVGLAASPGTDVLPTCSMRVVMPCNAARARS